MKVMSFLSLFSCCGHPVQAVPGYISQLDPLPFVTTPSPPQSASVSPGGVRPAAVSQTNPAPCFKLAEQLTCPYSVWTIFFKSFDTLRRRNRRIQKGVFTSLSGVTAGERWAELLLNGPVRVTLT